jgi:PRMT5 arginine-N-methyltransferase
LSLIVDEHRQYLSDRHRLSAFGRAIAAAVRPGDVVLDLASGTGILGLFACRAGAGRVYSIDSGGILELAREVAKANGYGDRIVFIKGFSKHVSLPERVDVVMSDQIGRFGFEAGVWEYHDDARRRFLKPGGILVPQRVDLEVAAVEDPALYSQVDFWDARPGGFDFSRARRRAANTGYPASFRPESLLSGAATVATISVASQSPAPVVGEACVSVKRAGTLHGIGGWFSALLHGDVWMTNSPLSTEAIDRRSAFLPIAQPAAVQPGDSVRVRIRILPHEVVLAWEVRVERQGDVVAEHRQSTWQGMLVTREDLSLTNPGHAPTLTPRGLARRTVLELCDGQRLLGAIESEVHRRHPDLFASPAEAAEFVAEVVTRYGERQTSLPDLP